MKTSSGKESREGQPRYNAPENWFFVNFTNYEDADINADGSIDPSRVTLTLPKPDLVFPSLERWITFREVVSDHINEFADMFRKKAISASSQDRILFGEIASALIIRSIKPLPPIGAGWRDVTLLAMELVTFYVTIWRFFRINKGNILSHTTAPFTVFDSKVESYRTTQISRNKTVVAFIEEDMVCWLPLWGLECHRLFPLTNSEWTKLAAETVLRCANELVSDSLTKAISSGIESLDPSLPRCIVSVLQDALRPGPSKLFLQTVRGGGSGGISPGKLLNRTADFIRQQIRTIEALPPERFPARFEL